MQLRADCDKKGMRQGGVGNCGLQNHSKVYNAGVKEFLILFGKKGGKGA